MVCVLMPCRALEAFRRMPTTGTTSTDGFVLMPCRALEAFRHSFLLWWLAKDSLGLNALSGIGGVQTSPVPRPLRPDKGRVLMPCRALEAFRRYGCRTRGEFGVDLS